MSGAIESQGFKLEIATVATASPVAYTEVKECTTFSGYDGQAAEIDVTHLQSDAKEFRMGLQDNGTYKVDVNYLPNDPGQILARAAKASRVIQPCRVTYSDGSTDKFSAFVISAPVSGAVDGKVDSSFSLRISGDVINTPAA